MSFWFVLLQKVGYCSHVSIPSYLKRLDTLKIPGSISRKEFFEFNKALPQLDDVGLALSLYSQSKKVISKMDFQRAVWAVTGVLMSRTQVGKTCWFCLFLYQQVSHKFEDPSSF